MIARPPQGVTLLELLVALAILAILAGVAGPGFGRAFEVPAGPETPRAVRAAMDRSVRERRAVRVTLRTDEGPLDLLALPDGRVFVMTDPPLDPRTGRRDP